ncbi:MAG: T9SS type A sorting domain-containing protein [Candidatus Kapaibacterium sp.]
MRNALLSLAVLVIAALSVSAQPTSITLLTPGANPGETYRAGVGYDITYKSDSTTYRSRFCFQFATSPNGPWTTMLGASNILDSTVSSQIRRGQFIGGFRAPAVVTSTGYIRMVLLNSDLTLNLNVTSICKNPITITQPPVTKVDSLLSGSITGNLTLSRNKIYGLRSYVHVLAGATLTIEPGTIIFGDSVGVNSALIINRGAKIMANGRPDAPIVMTSIAPAGQRAAGDWGGLIILGKAPCNNPGSEAIMEGGFDINDKTRWYYGGTDPNDNSGILRYVRVEFGGIALQPNQELNGITLGAVGRGTTMDHVQSSYANDDGFEWFGGSVDAKYIISNGALDDDFDTDNGFSGRVQFAVAQRYATRADQSTSQSFESDNDASATGNQPYTSAIFSNVTSIGPLSTIANTPNSRFGAAAQIRRNSRESIINSVFLGWPRGIEIAQSSTMGAAFNDSLVIRNCSWYGVKTTWLNLAGGTPPGPMTADWIKGSTFQNFLDASSPDGAMLENPFSDTKFSALPKAGSPLLNGASFVRTAGTVAVDDPYFDKVNYIGAFGTTRWDMPWANYDPINTVYVAGGPTSMNGSLKITYPNGGETVTGNSLQDIKYDTSNTYGMKFKFQFGLTPSGPWTDIISNVTDASARGIVKGGFSVPNTPTATAYIRMVMLNPDGTTNDNVADVSDAPFTITAGVSRIVKLLSPGKAAGEKYRAGNSYDISYDTTGNFRQRFRFEFGTSPTGPWTVLPGAGNVIDSNASGTVRRGLFIGGFRVPSTATTTGYIRMVQNSDTTQQSVSANPFEIVKPTVSKIDSILKDPITTAVTLSNTKIYGLKGYVHVLSGGVITLQPGTIVLGDEVGVNSALIINRGAKINAVGTPNLPIIFTSSAPPGQRAAGDWGGLIILGKARINNPGGEAIMEGGFDANDKTKWYYGGTDDDDNSGTLKYVRVEFGGIALQPNQELNGITLGGVGRGTTIDYVQSSYANDDGFEWFGGTVNAKHIIVNGALDDDFDTDNGFSGKIQFGVGQRYKNRADQSTSQAFESDNDASGSNNQPYTSAVFSNMTLVGPLADTATVPNSRFGAGAQIRRNSRESIVNSIFLGWGRGIEISSVGTMNAMKADSMLVKNCAWFGVKTTWVNLAGGTPPTGFDANWLAKPEYGNILDKATPNDAQLENPFVETTFNPQPKTGSPVLTGATFTKTGTVVGIDDDYFEKVAYRGAFGLQRWDLPWSNYDPINTDYKAQEVVGVEEDAQISGVAVEVLPNPAADYATVRYALSSSSKVSVRLSNAIGTVAENFVNNEFQSEGVYQFGINTSNLPNGMYFLQVITQGGSKITTQKITVVR